MGRLDIAMCLVPWASGDGREYLHEDQFRVALGSFASRVDRTVSHATPCRIAAAIVDTVRAAPAFAHQVHMLIGSESSKEVVEALLSDLVTQHGGGGGDAAAPQQCMIFASDGVSVLCEMIGNEGMKSVGDTVSRMQQIVLVALRYNSRTVTLVIVEQLSTALITSMLGSAWCNMWLALGGKQTIERSASVLLEALAVRDAAKSFSCHLEPVVRTQGDVEEMLQARASSDEEAQQLVTWHRQICTLREESEKSEYRRLAEEHAALKRCLTEREEYFTRQMEKSEQETERLKHTIQAAEANVLRLSKTETRIAELESQLTRKTEELRIHEESEAKGRLGREELQHQQQQQQQKKEEMTVVAHPGRKVKLDEPCGTRDLYEREDVVDTLQRELFAAQAALRDTEQRLSELKEENLLIVMEFQQKEKVWQSELKREENERIAALKECLQLRNVVTSQGSSMNVVRETVQATQAMQEQELDDLLLKVRAISSANASAFHRRVSPSLATAAASRNGIRLLSPRPSVKIRLPA